MNWQKMEKKDDSKSKLVAGLKQGALGSDRTKTARLREIFDEVEAAKASGLHLKTIVEILRGRGLDFELATFVNIRHRIKNERRKGIQLPGSKPKTTEHGVAVPGVAVSVDKQKEKKTETESLEMELVKPPGITNSMWSEMKAKEAAAKRKKT